MSNSSSTNGPAFQPAKRSTYLPAANGSKDTKGCVPTPLGEKLTVMFVELASVFVTQIDLKIAAVAAGTVSTLFATAETSVAL